SCIHGNETTGFFDMCHILNLLVNQWEKYPQLTYLRKNVRLIYVPMVNPWGFANQKRENVNNVDLNRNFDYNWKAGKG
ncbi:M14 family metallopeptidase, partial [Staphylococcus saprophyticus]